MSTSLNTSIEPQFRTIDGLKIRFAESEQGDDHALLLSPWPESLHAFDQVWGRLAKHAHLVAVDLPGFGHSERRDSLLAPRAMGEFVIRLADEFGLEHPHAVGPDIGTGALLFAAADNPGRLRSIVLGSGGASFPLELGGILNDWVVAPDVEGYRAADPREIVSAAVSGIERYELPDSVREDYLSAYEGGSSSRCVTCAPTRGSCRSLPSCSRRSRPRWRSSAAFGTGRCHRATTGTCTSGCPRATST
jgi:pimeloyl-ACP methyl ester carboxylesterase